MRCMYNMQISLQSFKLLCCCYVLSALKIITMPYKCKVPKCRGNYDNGPKVSIFRFPSDEISLERWKSAIPRDWIITKNSRVCELHFENGDIETVATGYDKKSATTVSIPLAQKRLKKGAIPRIFPGRPTYLSTTASTRVNPDEKRERTEREHFFKGFRESVETQNKYELKHCFDSLQKLQNIMENNPLPKDWQTVAEKDKVIFYKLNCDAVPSVICSLKIDESLMTNIYFKNVELSKISDYEFPLKISNINHIYSIIEHLGNLPVNFAKQSQNDLISLCCDILNTLNVVVDDDEKKCRVNFLLEQVKHLNFQKYHFRYDSDYLILCALTYSISPHAYRFLRNSNYFVMPHPSTLQSICK